MEQFSGSPRVWTWAMPRAMYIFKFLESVTAHFPMLLGRHSHEPWSALCIIFMQVSYLLLLGIIARPHKRNCLIGSWHLEKCPQPTKETWRFFDRFRHAAPATALGSSRRFGNVFFFSSNSWMDSRFWFSLSHAHCASPKNVENWKI